MRVPAISKEQILAALAAGPHAPGSQRHGKGEHEHHRSLDELSMDDLAAAAGVSRATLYRLFGSQQALLAELGFEPPPTVRGRILDAALEMLGRHGLTELPMDELAATAGVSRATLYRLFPGKAALFAELVRRFSPLKPIAAVLATAEDRPPAEVIRAVAHDMAQAMDGRMGLLLQLLFEFYRSDPGTRASLAAGSEDGVAQGMRTLPLVTRYLSGQMSAGRLRRMDPALAFQALAGPIVMHLQLRPLAATHAGAMPAGVAPLGEVVDELVGLWLRAMVAGDPAAPEPPAPPDQQSPASPRRKDDAQPNNPATGQPAQPRP